jgi:hypothetical protein
MSYNTTKYEQEFAISIAGVKSIGFLVKEAMQKNFIHIALDFLAEEKYALSQNLSILEKIADEIYQKTFGEMIPAKLKDIDFAINICNQMLFSGDFLIPSNEEENNFKEKAIDLKIKNYSDLKDIATSLSQNDFANTLTERIKNLKTKSYQA